MPGLSRRTQRFSRWLIAAVAIILFITFEAFAIYLLILKGRLDRELLRHDLGRKENLLMPLPGELAQGRG